MKSGFRDISTGFILIAFAIFGYITANNFSDPSVSYGSDFFPKLILILLAILSLVLCVKGILNIKNDKSNSSFDKRVFFRIALFMTLLIVYINLFLVTGFIVSSIVFLIIAQYLFGLRKWLKLVLVSVIMPLILYYLFTVLFNIPLP